VTAIPTASAMAIVRVSITSPVVGRSTPTASKSAFSPAAAAKPPGMPTSAPHSPIATASIATEARICGREAPSVRNKPNSDTRWATVIEKVLKIRKAPTSTATKPKTSSRVDRKPRLSRISSELRAAFSVPVSTRAERGRARSSRLFSAVGETPSRAATEIWSKRPRLWVSRWATGSVTWAMLAPPKEALPSRVKPTRRKERALPWPTIRSGSPSARPAASAAALSIEASPGPRGGWPSR